jgi:non-canonical (house-cleaning) NTP pyrophosphatase
MKTEIDVPKVYLSSKSPVKLVAAKRAFARVGLQIETIDFAVESGVVAQPLSIEETHAGAQNRHAELRRQVGAVAGYLVTDESGIVKPFPGANWKGCEVVIVEKQPGGPCVVGIDIGVEYPQEMMDKIPDVYPDLGVLMQEEYGFTEKDPPSYLTKGRLSRADLIEQALFKVLAQMDV